MKTHFLLAALALALLSQSARAAFMPTLNMDGLLFASESVVEGPIVAVHARNYNLNAQVRVEHLWAGQNFGKTLTVGDLELYSKRLSQDREGNLSRGDRVILFLQTAPAELQSPMRERFWALSSGVRLVRGGRVTGFRQFNNPGGYDELPGVPRAVFTVEFKASRQRVAWLKARLHAPPRLEDAAFFEVWNARCKSDAWSFGGISSAVGERLAQIHKLNSHKSNQ